MFCAHTFHAGYYQIFTTTPEVGITIFAFYICKKTETQRCHPADKG